MDPDTGAQTVLASGGYLSLPFDLGMDGFGRLILTDSGRLIRLNPGTEDQELLGDGSDRVLGYPAGIAVDWSGQVLVTTGASILRLNPASGQVSVLSSGGYFDFPIGLSIASPGQLFVLNLGFPPQVLRVNPNTGFQTLIAQGGRLSNPQGIAVDGNQIYVTDTGDYHSAARVVRINAQSGRQTVIASGEYLLTPVGIAIEESGALIVADASTINPDSADIESGGYDGAIIRMIQKTATKHSLLAGTVRTLTHERSSWSQAVRRASRSEPWAKAKGTEPLPAELSPIKIRDPQQQLPQSAGRAC